jgi:hypothetical protein
MGFKAGNTKIGEADPLMGLPILTKDEVLFLLNTIRKTEFKGEDIERLFNLTLKLQKMFVDLDKFKT